MQKLVLNARPAWCLALPILLAFAAAPAAAVILDGTNECTVKLNDGTDVVLYGEFVSRIGSRSADGEDEPALPVAPDRPAQHSQASGALR